MYCCLEFVMDINEWDFFRKINSDQSVSVFRVRWVIIYLFIYLNV